MRQIDRKLVLFFEAKLKNNSMYAEALKNKDARLLYMLANQACVGVREVGGNNKGAMVELLQETLGSAESEAWCMSAQQSCLAFAEVKTGIKSPIFDSEHCMTVWNKTPKAQRVKLFPLAGAMIIWVHGKGPAGHTGCLESTDGKTMFTYEGNTNAGLDAKGSVAREGGGFYRNARSFTGSGSMKVVGFLKPF